MLRKKLLEEFSRRPHTWLTVAELRAIISPETEIVASDDGVKRSADVVRSRLRKRVLTHRKIRYHVNRLVENQELMCVYDEGLRTKKYRWIGQQSGMTSTMTISTHWFTNQEGLFSMMMSLAPHIQMPLHIDHAERLLAQKTQAITHINRCVQQYSSLMFVLHIHLGNIKKDVISEFLASVLSDQVRAVVHVPATQIIIQHSILVSLARLNASDYVTIVF